MAQHAAAFANRQRAANRAGHILLRELGGFLERAPESEMRRDGRRKRASGAMRVVSVDARCAKFRERPSVEQQVHDLAAGAVPAGNNNGGGAEIVNTPRGVSQILVR